MTDSANEDSVTKLNTQLNKSMVLMENAVDTPSPNQKRKSITINTEAKPPRTAVKSRRSILKRSSKSDDNLNDEVARLNGNVEELNEKSSPPSILSRPHTVNGSFMSLKINFNYSIIILIIKIEKPIEQELHPSIYLSA